MRRDKNKKIDEKINENIILNKSQGRAVAPVAVTTLESAAAAAAAAVATTRTTTTFVYGP